MINRNIKVGALIAESIDISYSNDYSTVIEEAFYWYECDKNGVLLEE
jgi:hypothetical protein